MRYSEGYHEWIDRAEKRMSPNDRELAGMTRAKIRDNFQSDYDKKQYERLTNIYLGGKSDDYESTPVKKEQPKPTPKPRSKNLRLVTISVEGAHIEFEAMLGELTVDFIESQISSQLAARVDLDWTIFGFEKSKLTKKRFTGQIHIADYDEEEECDIFERWADVEGTISAVSE